MIEYKKNMWKMRLKNPLGLDFQLKMAPRMRKSDILNYQNISNTVQSSVLILLFYKNNEPHILLTRRSEKLNKHGGQISFPGGKVDETDIDFEFTALREAREEIGLDEVNVEILGKLTPLLIPVTNYCVNQIVAFTPQLPKLEANAGEVKSIIEVAISDLLMAENTLHKSFGATSSGRIIEAPYYYVENVEIWGATAMMISELLHTLFIDKS